MKFQLHDPPRVFAVGNVKVVRITDCARIQLEPDEQVTFSTESGGEYDVVRKPWGFYATPSLNGRLQRFGLRAALIKSTAAKYYIFLIESGKEAECQSYMDIEGHRLICWLDDDRQLAALEHLLQVQ